MTRNRAWIVGGTVLIVAVFATTGAVVYALFFSDWPGGMRPSYPVADYDRRLTEEARSALPIAGAVQAYFATHGTYPERASQLRDALPSSRFTSEEPCGSIDGWMYCSGPGAAGFTLTRRLGWDPSLQYSWDGTTETWLFDPGDGSPRTTVKLRP